eukprot:SAG31_NODE_1806_length_7230_cov_40.014164_4_plen_72_part_00
MGKRYSPFVTHDQMQNKIDCVNVAVLCRELRYTAWRRCLGGGVAVAVEHVNMAGLLGWGAREFGLEDPFLG